jgi:uncharacterized membrane protein
MGIPPNWSENITNFEDWQALIRRAMVRVMEMLDILGLIEVADWAALAVLLAAWAGIGLLIERPWGKRTSVTLLMSEYRREWMRQFVTRQNRIADAQIVVSLRQNTSFFASTSLLALGAVLALVGNPQPLEGAAEGLIHVDLPVQVWQTKLLVVALFLAQAFLKFVWSNRVFGYCSVVMAAVPDDPVDPHAMPRAVQAGELNIRGALNFNRGLRSMYFALAALAWLLGAAALALATLVVIWVLWSREFASSPRDILSHKD